MCFPLHVAVEESGQVLPPPRSISLSVIIAPAPSSPFSRAVRSGGPLAPGKTSESVVYHLSGSRFQGWNAGCVQRSRREVNTLLFFYTWLLFFLKLPWPHRIALVLKYFQVTRLLQSCLFARFLNIVTTSTSGNFYVLSRHLLWSGM